MNQLLFILICCFFAQSAQSIAETNWLSLPEEMTNADSSASIYSEDNALDSLKQISAAHQAALEKVDPDSITQNGRWGLALMSHDIGITHTGRLGLLPFHGNAAATIWWHPRSSEGVEKNQPEHSLELSQIPNEGELKRQIVGLVNIVAASAKVKSKQKRKMTEDLFSIAKRFMEVAAALRYNPNPYWQVQKFYLDQSVTVGGSWVPVVSTKATVRVRLNWDVSQNSSHSVYKMSTPQAQNLENLVRWLAEDLAFAASHLPVGQEFQAKKFKIGLGVGLGGFGLVKINYKATGILELARTTTPLPPPGQMAPGNDFFYLQAQNPSEKEIAFAKAEKIDFLADDKDKDGIIDDIAYRLNRTRLREGLVYSFGLGHRLASSAQTSSGHWSVSRVDAAFSMGVSSKFIISLLDRSGTSEITFVRRNP